MSTIRDYTSIYTIKDFALNEVAPKFFDFENVNKLNVGLLGYTTELAASTTEDVLNIISTYIKEMFPNQAQIPETLYNFAAMLNISNLLSTPAEIDMMLFISEKDILKMAEKKETVYEFILDSDLIVDIEGQQFMLDYDIKINGRIYAGETIFTAQYIMDFVNSISNITNPYIKTSTILMNNQKYLILIVKMHRVNKFKQVENLISNDKINLPTINVEFSDQLANFEVFYKPPGATNYTQLKKRLFTNTPIKEPFCYYKLREDNRIDITFTIRDNYFQPAFNSELLIVTYTTNGVGGNFPEYKGSSIFVTASSETYDYNNNLIVFAVPRGDSVYGKDKLSLEELRRMILELRSTTGAYNSENDLQLYFQNYENIERNKVLFIKKRDDTTERLFAAFSLFKDLYNNFYPTNTVNMDILPEEFDIRYEQSNMIILKTGRLFRYVDKNTKNKVVPIGIETISGPMPVIDDEHIYTNPYLIIIQKDPSVIGFYLNSVNDKIPLDFTYVNGSSIAQFICNNVIIKRNALIGESHYTVTVSLIPASPLEYSSMSPVESGLIYNERLKVMMTVEDDGEEIAFKLLDFKSYDKENDIYTFETTIETNDMMTLSEKFSISNFNKMVGGTEEESILIPMRDCVVNFHSLYRYENNVIGHRYQNLLNLSTYSLTNTYSTRTQRAKFITPMNIMRARVKYLPRAVPEGNDAPPYSLFLSFIPLIGAQRIKDKPSDFDDFLSMLYRQFDYLQGIVNKKTNNYGIDLKFFNTFGRSSNFIVGEDGEILDKTNISIHFKVFPTVGALEDVLIRDLKIFIKDYIENINISMNNAFYVSNLIQEIENRFPDVKYLKFVRINNYDSSVQAIENIQPDSSLLTKDQLHNYVPEYLAVHLDDIYIDILSN